MYLKDYNQLPENLKNDYTYEAFQTLRKRKVSLFLKRIFDIIMSTLLIIILSPVLLILAIWIKLDSKGPVFYRQHRVTIYGKDFRIFKFRTMVTNADKIGSLVTLNNDSRITKVGKMIRKSRLDEIPQLFNIFLGQMSFVGTRPEVQKYVDAYTDEMKVTLLLPAGVTSKASIEYKSEDEILDKYVDENHSVDEVYINQILPEKMKYNIDYINKVGLIEDIKTCINTVIN